MSLLPIVRCQGAPRDLGLDQGRAAQEEIQAAARRVRPDSWLPRTAFEAFPTGRPARLRRDTLRYFPHMGERAIGLARGAGVGTATIAALLGRESEGSDGCGLVASWERTGGGPLVARTYVSPVTQGAPPLWIRASAPEMDYASVEVTLPWRVPAIAGVNEKGLAVTATRIGTPLRRDAVSCAPAELLVQDCLQRFDSVDAAIDWCQRRPAAGDVSLLLADADGNSAGVAIEENGARVFLGSAGVILGLGERAACAALEKSCAERPVLDEAGVYGALKTVSPPGAARIVIDPSRRRLGVTLPDGVLAWFEPEPRS